MKWLDGVEPQLLVGCQCRGIIGHHHKKDTWCKPKRYACQFCYTGFRIATASMVRMGRNMPNLDHISGGEMCRGHRNQPAIIEAAEGRPERECAAMPDSQPSGERQRIHLRDIFSGQPMNRSPLKPS